MIPQINDIVMCRVTKMTTFLVRLDLISVNGIPLPASVLYQGVIKREDVRKVEIDSVVMYNCFRPTDIVRAHVVSLGSNQSYNLSTSNDDEGVILATSSAGYPMVPISWQEMKCPQTGAIENRKVAKII